MSSRHTRRKRAKARQLAKAEGIAQAHRAWEIAEIVKRNKSAPIERNYYSSVSPTARLQDAMARARGTGGITRSLAGYIDTRGGKRRFVPK